MRYAGMLAGLILGGRSRLLGALVGGVLGYQAGAILEAARKASSRNARSLRNVPGSSLESSNRYPEEQMLEAMRRDEEDPEKQAAELDDILGSVSGTAGKATG
ncbi:MAG: hypothetical protein R6V08_02270 [Desulfuromonadales bacterium]